MDNTTEFLKVGSTKNILCDIINECFNGGNMMMGGGTFGTFGTGGRNMFNKLVFSELLFNQFGGKSVKKWTTFSHNGVLFPEPYQAHGIPLIYGDKKEKIYLDPESEEYATIYSKFVDTEYVKNKLFKQNFYGDWKKYLKKGGFNQVVSLELCDFSLIYAHVLKMKEEKKKESDGEKGGKGGKGDKGDGDRRYTEAMVDNKVQAVGNFRIEPPGIFLGRGCHPLAGKIKKRILPEDITINIDNKSKIPELPLFYKYKKWGKIIHDNTLEWLASWKDTITGKTKYVWLGNKSDFKAKSDLHKYEKARKLAKHIDNIRLTNMNNISITGKSDDDIQLKQLGCALYLIDNLALRVGNEKGEDEADTVGVCSLRIEHIELIEPNIVKLDFLGKDSIRYENKVKVDNNVFNALFLFSRNKKKDDDLFDKINPSLLNTYIKTISSNDDLTAKVFRTYNASYLFQKEIDEINKKYNTPSLFQKKVDEINKKYNSKSDKEDYISELLTSYNKANLKVALLCNHQKNVSKGFNDQIKKIDDKIEELQEKKVQAGDDKDKIKKINAKIKDLKNKKSLKVELKNVSLGTSKINYIDPRITVAFLKKHNIKIEKIFSPTLIDKFFWAMDVDEKWKF
jgi:DNA topoisomerase I